MKHYNVLIVEDEIPAQANLRRAIERYFDDLTVVGVESSVQGTVHWLEAPDHHADIIFMDVELSDGMCFDIFTQTAVKGKVVITTAYDNYAVKAFRIHSIDYLLKPIDHEQLQAAVARCRTALEAQNERQIDLDLLRSLLVPDTNTNTNTNIYKRRFVVKFGDRLSVIDTAQVAYIHAGDKTTFLVTTENRSYVLDASLDTASEQLDPQQFFRISRNCTVSVRAIAGISKHPSNRLKVTLDPKPDFEVFVSRSRTADFMQWLEGER